MQKIKYQNIISQLLINTSLHKINYYNNDFKKIILEIIETIRFDLVNIGG